TPKRADPAATASGSAQRLGQNGRASRGHSIARALSRIDRWRLKPRDESGALGGEPKRSSAANDPNRAVHPVPQPSPRPPDAPGRRSDRPCHPPFAGYITRERIPPEPVSHRAADRGMLPATTAMAIYPPPEQMKNLLAGPASRPVVMVNLLRFK